MLVKYHTVSYCDAPIVRYLLTLLWTQQLDALLSMRASNSWVGRWGLARPQKEVELSPSWPGSSSSPSWPSSSWSSSPSSSSPSSFQSSHTCEISTRQEKLACVASADSTTLIPHCLFQCNWIAPNVAKTFWIDNIPGGNATDMQIQIHKYVHKYKYTTAQHPGAMLVMRPIQSVQFGFYQHYCMHTNTRQWCSLSWWVMRMKNNEYVSWLMDGPDPEAVVTYMASVIVVTHCFLWVGSAETIFSNTKHVWSLEHGPEVPCVDCQWFLTLNQVKLTNPVFGQLSTDDSGIVFSVGNWSCGLSPDSRSKSQCSHTLRCFGDWFLESEWQRSLWRSK